MEQSLKKYRKSSGVALAIIVLMSWAMFLACRPPERGVVSLENELKRGETNVLKHYLGNARAANTVLKKRGGYFTTPLIVAAEVADTNAISLLLSAGADVNGTNESGPHGAVSVNGF